MIEEIKKTDEQYNLIYCRHPEFVAEILVDHRNQRIRVLGYLANRMDALVNYLNELAGTQPVGKIIIYAFNTDWKELLALGFHIEGVMSGYYRGDPAYCMSSFIQRDRARSDRVFDEDLILRQIVKHGVKIHGKRNTKYTIRRAERRDINDIKDIFLKTFATYPSPIENRAYLEGLISRDEYVILVAEHGGEIAGIVSADIDSEHLCAEITDCVVCPEHRGNGVIGNLVDCLEAELKNKGLRYLYSLARAGVLQINAVFHNRGYLYKGRLLNNCNICGRFENMNIWEKKLENFR